MTRTMTATATHEFSKLHNDHWVDEIRLIGPDGPILRLATFPRWKTSGLSGCMWRTSTAWQAKPGLMKGAEPNERTPGWDSFDGGYGHGLAAGCAALYSGLYGLQPQACDIPVDRVEFLRKGAVLWSVDRAEPLPLLVAAGHLPWWLVLFNEEPTGSVGVEQYRDKCHQPGCQEKAVSTYLLKKQKGRGPGGAPVRLSRHFCPVHLRRGDSHRVDCDENYEVIEGPGPEGRVGWLKLQSRAQLV